MIEIDHPLEPRPLAEQAVRALAEQTAEIAAQRSADVMAEKVIAGIFWHLGVDVHDTERMAELRDNLAFLARMNRGAREIKSAAVKTCVGSVIAGLLAAIGIGVKTWLSQP